MFVLSSHVINNHQRIGVKSDFASAGPHKLILMLFKSAQQTPDRSRLYLRKNKIAAMGEMISKAIASLDHGLKASLDVKAGGQLAKRLYQPYGPTIRQLLTANTHSSFEIVVEANRLLIKLHDAWAAIKRTTVHGAA